MEVVVPAYDTDELEPVFFCEERHKNSGEKESKEDDNVDTEWRMKQKLKTMHVALALCLNIGVDPPDVVKVQPCANLECWLDPQSLPQRGAVDHIGAALKEQYERWQQRARYKQCCDPTIDDISKMCNHLRRSAQNEGVLFHYNGHGVPRPTENGEIWVFNRHFTQYIPLAVQDLHKWMGTPSIYVFDCSAAGLLIRFFAQLNEQQDFEKATSKVFSRNKSASSSSKKSVIVLAACGPNEMLPMNPDLPADLFTSCLTTPIKMALRWFCLQNKLVDNVTMELVDNLPGKIKDRKSPLGELDWIFTAITDTIAWNALPRDLFQKLFRQDLLLSSLFRNFLLANRIMRMCDCTPMSYPELPDTHNHPLWGSWDLAVDTCIAQLKRLYFNPGNPYINSSFFKEQLNAFQVWLNFGHKDKKPPEQLPILLQVLLSQVHRLRALSLLGKFLDMGPWAVSLALSVGFFPYVQKLLQTRTSDTRMKQVLVFIWVKILALDKTCQVELIKEGCHTYFIDILRRGQDIDPDIRAMSCFVLSVVMDGFPDGKICCLNQKLLSICLTQLQDPDPLLRRWLCLCISKLLQDCESAKETAIKEHGHDRVAKLLSDSQPEVRAAAVYLLQFFIGDHQTEKDESRIQFELQIGSFLIEALTDGSPLVRKELVKTLAVFLEAYKEHISPALFRQIITEDDYLRRKVPLSASASEGGSGPNTTRRSSSADESSQEDVLGNQSKRTFLVLDLVRVIVLFCSDPHPDVGKNALQIINYLGKTFFGNSFDASGSSSLKRKQHFSRRTQSTSSLREFNASDSSNPSSSSPPSSSYSLPVSSFYEWSAQHFSQPLLYKSEEEDETGPLMAKRKTRYSQNKSVINEALHHFESAGRQKLEHQIGMLDNETSSMSSLLFHPFDPHLIVTDNANGVSVWNWNKGSRCNFFNNSTNFKERITSIDFVNEHYESMLLTASSHGNVFLYRDYALPSQQKLVTAFRAAPGALSSANGPGIITEWQPSTGILYVSGEIGFVKIWNMEKEICSQSVHTETDSCVTSLTSDWNGTPLVAAGCGDGSIRLFDQRSDRHSLISTLEEHKQWIVDVHMQRHPSSTNLISGSISGEIKFWDLRNPSRSLKTIEAHRSAMTALAVHPYAPVIASGSNNQIIKVFNTNCETLSMIYYHDGFLGQRIGPVSSLAFHPHVLCLAAGATDSIISLYGGDGFKPLPFW